ncbi:MAG: Thymidylate synthase ThyX [Dehalococcoidia bacterium]|nr:Thymidylate synthase ThyX [Chloroflexota bacterium]
MIDPYFKVVAIARTENPQRVIWQAAHQCVCEGATIDDPTPTSADITRNDELVCGKAVVKHLLAGNKGHFSPCEMAYITFNVIGFPHRVVQQASRHRHLSFSVQSFRYSGQRIASLGEQLNEVMSWNDRHLAEIEKLFYLRPVGEYAGRSGGRYSYPEDSRRRDLITCGKAALEYYQDLQRGTAPEQACGLLPMDTRQNWVVSGNLRAWLHFLDLRSKADAQLEIVQLSELLWAEIKDWVPEIASWYAQNRYGKARLAP